MHLLKIYLILHLYTKKIRIMQKHRSIPLLFAAIASTALSAQTAQRTVLANAGTTATLPNNYTVSWTLGEAFVATRTATAAKLIVTEGFQQPESGTVPTIELPDAIGQVTISPNPTGNALTIALLQMPAVALRARLIDASGHTLREADLHDLTTVLHLTGLPAAW